MQDAIDRYGVTGYPTMTIEGVNWKQVGWSPLLEPVIIGKLDTYAARSRDVAITASRSGTSPISITGSVKNVSGGNLSNLTVHVWAVEIMEDGHAVNTVRSIFGTKDIASLADGASEPFDISGSEAVAVTIVISVFDSLDYSLNSKALP